MQIKKENSKFQISKSPIKNKAQRSSPQRKTFTTTQLKTSVSPPNKLNFESINKEKSPIGKRHLYNIVFELKPVSN